MTNVVGSTPVVMSNPTVRSPGNMAYSKAFRILGIFQILLGTLSIFTWSYTLAFALSGYSFDVFAYISAGMWCGIFFLVAGILATVSSVDPNNCKIVAGTVMSILAAIFAFILFALEVAGITALGGMAQVVNTSSSYCTPYYQAPYFQSSVYVPTCTSPARAEQYIKAVYIPSTYVGCYSYSVNSGSVGMSTLHGFMAFFAFAELIVAIVHAVYCCKYKRLSNSAPTTVQYVTSYQHPNAHSPATSIDGGIPMTTVNYPDPTYVNQSTSTPVNQPVTGNVMSQTFMTSSGMTSPPSGTSPPTTSPPDITSSTAYTDVDKY